MLRGEGEEGREGRIRRPSTLLAPVPDALASSLDALQARLERGARLTAHELGMLRDWAIVRAMRTRRSSVLATAINSIDAEQRAHVRTPDVEPPQPRALPEP